MGNRTLHTPVNLLKMQGILIPIHSNRTLILHPLLTGSIVAIFHKKRFYCCFNKVFDVVPCALLTSRLEVPDQLETMHCIFICALYGLCDAVFRIFEYHSHAHCLLFILMGIRLRRNALGACIVGIYLYSYYYRLMILDDVRFFHKDHGPPDALNPNVNPKRC